MASTRETALAGLHTVLAALSGPTVQRNGKIPTEIPVGGLLNLNDGEAGEPVDVVLSPTIYSYEHRAEIDVLVQDGTETERDSALDTLLLSIDTAIAADTTLGGTVDRVEAQAPEEAGTEPVKGGSDIKGCIVPVILYYETTRPLL